MTADSVNKIMGLVGEIADIVISDETINLASVEEMDEILAIIKNHLMFSLAANKVLGERNG